MDLQILPGSFSDTTFRVKAVTESGQNFLGVGTEFGAVPKSNLPLAIRAAKVHGLTMA